MRVLPSRLVGALLAWSLLGLDAAAQTKVDVGGRSLEVLAEGSGGPTVVLEAGLTRGLSTWRSIIPPVSEFAHVVAYSRAGYEGSDPASDKRGPAEIVRDLRSALRKLDLSPPYVLVAHSVGAFYARYYASAFPTEVAGLVLIDGSHERMELEFARITGEGLAPFERPKFRGTADQEMDGLANVWSTGALGLPGGPPDIPVAILTSLRVAPGPDVSGSEHGRQITRRLHAELFRQSTYGMHLVTDRSGHYIHVDEPELVVDAIRWVIDAVGRR